jgi:sugar phosphate isomerase/epimerase
MKKLAKYVLSTHVKDLKPQKGVAADEWFFFSCTPVGDGMVDNSQLVKELKAVNYPGFLAVEIDFLHPDYHDDEDKAIEQSVQYLKRISA